MALGKRGAKGPLRKTGGPTTYDWGIYGADVRGARKGLFGTMGGGPIAYERMGYMGPM